MLLAIDPGADQGWAIFTDEGELKECGLGDPPSYRPLAGAQCIVEMPRIYPAAQMKGDPNDIVKLAVRVGRALERAEMRGYKTRTVFPRDWKGTIDGDIMCARILAKLNAKDRAVYDKYTKNVPEGKRHNVTDAVGLGKYALLLLEYEKLSG